MIHWQMYNPNPVRGDGVGDCAIRAISAALDISWEKAFALLSVNAFLMGNIVSADEVWGALLRKYGFRRYAIPNTCPDCYTLEDFALDHPQGTYVVKSFEHVAAVIDGVLFDSYDSRWKLPQYYWTDNYDMEE